MRHPDDVSPSPAEQLDQFLATTKTFLAQLRVLDHAGKNNLPPRPYLTEQSPATKEEREEFDASNKSYVDEWARIVDELRQIRASMYQRLRPQVSDFLPDIEIDYPAARGCEKRHNELFEELKKDDSETGMRTYLLGLDTVLLRIRNRAVEGPTVDSTSHLLKQSDNSGFVSNNSEQSVPQVVGDQLPPPPVKRRRGPDLELSKKRIDLLNSLVGELTAIHQKRSKYRSVDALKGYYPEFAIWRLVPEKELSDLVEGDFKPKAFATTLVLRTYGNISPETLKKDRRKLREANPRS